MVVDCVSNDHVIPQADGDLFTARSPMRYLPLLFTTVADNKTYGCPMAVDPLILVVNLDRARRYHHTTGKTLMVAAAVCRYRVEVADASCDAPPVRFVGEDLPFNKLVIWGCP